ncbi:hypothetical protein LZQ00_06455 [Sphingobacterium sp. SRCM116780]|uniref:hypothetical protein n=1 Tax=Sphingobacterium sp. SRCM116780 TaxID=2907623 RepID=UPI001F278EC0|nr:hypothetical protein [Sphingobacterium sp. SRCM116780]UIR57455.1 hypothetical protein LZQ00_06455 [Sphingobacterium sp. SRCM116780]
MNPIILVAIISATASIIVATVSFILNKRAERRDYLQQKRLAHYQELLASISDLAIKQDLAKANLRFANAVNTIGLIAPQNVITALMEFHREIRISNPNFSIEGHDTRLKVLILEIRKSLNLPYKDNPETFTFHLVGI